MRCDAPVPVPYVPLLLAPRPSALRTFTCGRRVCVCAQYHLAYDDLDWVKGLSTSIAQRLHSKSRGTATPATHDHAKDE